MNKKRVSVNSPLSGTVVGLDAVPDPQFATGALGAGIAVVPDAGVEVVEIRAPFHARISRSAPNMYVFEELMEQIPVFRTDPRGPRPLGNAGPTGARPANIGESALGPAIATSTGARPAIPGTSVPGAATATSGGAGAMEATGPATVVQPRKLLLHIGVDTGRLNGQGFAPHVEQGDVVPCGAPICTYVPRELGRMGFDPIVMMVVLRQSGDELEYQAMPGEPCDRGDVLFRF